MSDSKKIDDGGSAFPVDASIRRGMGCDGMSLRDWFAGQALSGLMSYTGDETSGNWHNNSSSEGVAIRCYELSDAMIATRKAGAP